MFGAIAILSIFSIAVAFAPSWPVFTVLFFIVGMGQIGCYIVVFVLGKCCVQHLDIPPLHWLHVSCCSDVDFSGVHRFSPMRTQLKTPFFFWIL